MLNFKLRLPVSDQPTTLGATPLRYEEFEYRPSKSQQPSLNQQFKARSLAKLYTFGDAVSLKRVLINVSPANKREQTWALRLTAPRAYA